VRKLFRNILAIIIIKMSSRSLAAARSRRAGENAPPVSGNRPITSTGSAAAFSNMNQPSNNVRVSRQQQPPQQQFQQPPQQFQQQQPPRQQSTSFQQVKQSQQQAQSSQPFSKLSISDAVGLITLRLGRIEQWVIESEHNDEPSNNSNSNSTNLPDNSKIVDNSVFLSIIDRLDTIEKDKTTATPGTSESVAKLTEEFTKISEQLNKVCDESNKQIMSISKHTEQLFRFERELVETKDILKTFMLKYDSFVAESNERFSDYEVAMTELEKSIQIESAPLAVVEGTTINDIDVTETYNVGDDLKNMVEQELSSSSNI
jgi:hypothetical protein